ncbi:MAG: DUF6798 domain-containing protein [Planctomycetota bacterium]
MTTINQRHINTPRSAEDTSLQVKPMNNRLSSWLISTYLITLTLFATLPEYRYGFVNHIEQLPPILGLIDSNWLANDEFVQISKGFGPRYYYYHFMAMLGKAVPLPAVMLAALFAANFLGLWTANLWARLHLPGMPAGEVILPALMFPAFDDSVFVPASICWPLFFWLITVAGTVNPAWCVSACIFSLMMHPLIGLFSCGFYLIFLLTKALSTQSHSAIYRWAPLVSVTAATSTATAVLYLLWQHKTIDSATFVQIVGHYRHPHHYIMSSLPVALLLHWAGWFAISVLAMGLILQKRRLAMPQLAPYGVMLVCCAAFYTAGYVLVEVYPVRTVATIQPERLWNVLGMVKHLFLGVLATQAVYCDTLKGARWVVAALFVINCCWGPAGLLALSILAVVGHRGLLGRSRLLTFAVAAVASACGWVLSAAINDGLYDRLSLIGAPLVLAVLAVHRRPTRQWLSAAPAVGLIAALVWFYNQPHGSISNTIDTQVPRVVLGDRDVRYGRLDFYTAVSEQTPPGCRLIVPPYDGQVRLFSQRAIVVDFKAFPFQDDAILEWYDRCLRLYGSQSSYSALVAHYNDLGDEALMEFGRKYSADYAVIDGDVATELPVIAESSGRKLVGLRGDEPPSVD